MAFGHDYVMETYARFPIGFVRGEGVTLYDQEGKAYTDFLAGIAVCSLGYSNKAYKEALHNQVDNLLHTSNYYWIEPQVQLAQLLVENSFADKAFFGNSGAEANEGAIKLARRYAFDKGYPEKNKVIAFANAFHGRTLATLSLTHGVDNREGYGPAPEGFEFAKFNDLASVEALMDDNTCAVIMEPIQGEGGVYPATAEFMAGVRELCNKHDALLIFDEIQCGMGRTGKLFCYEHYNVTPDIVTLAKALANGVPIGCILTTDKYAATFCPGRHGTTFGGNHLATAAGVATVTEMLDKNIPARAETMGIYFKNRLEELVERFDCAVAVRGMGLMLALELNQPAKPFVEKGLAEGFVLNVTATNVLRFLPPLIIEESHVDALIDFLADQFETA